MFAFSCKEKPPPVLGTSCLSFAQRLIAFENIPVALTLQNYTGDHTALALKIGDHQITTDASLAFLVKLSNPGTYELLLVDTLKGDTLLKDVLNVKPIPEPLLSFNDINVETNLIDENQLPFVNEIRAEFRNWDFDVYVPVKGCSIMLVSGYGVFETRIKGHKIEGAVLDRLRALKQGDRLIIFDVVVELPGQQEKVLGSKLYKVVGRAGR